MLEFMQNSPARDDACIALGAYSDRPFAFEISVPPHHVLCPVPLAACRYTAKQSLRIGFFVFFYHSAIIFFKRLHKHQLIVVKRLFFLLL